MVNSWRSEVGSVDGLQNSTLGLVFGLQYSTLGWVVGLEFIFGLGKPTTVLNFGFCNRTTALDFRLGCRTTVFNSGFGSQTTVLNFGFGSRTIAVTSRRSDSSNVSLVVLDKSLIILSKPLFWKIRKSMTDRPTDRQTDRQDLRIKSPRRRLKIIIENFKNKFWILREACQTSIVLN